MPKPDEQLVEQAQMVLDFNWNGEYTRPGLHPYPHQWSWDSALIAIGYALRPGARHQRAHAPLRESVEKRAAAPDNLQPQVQTILPRHRLLARRAQPQRPSRS